MDNSTVDVDIFFSLCDRVLKLTKNIFKHHKKSFSVGANYVCL